MSDSIARLDREMEFAPDMPSPLLDAIMDVRNELSRMSKPAFVDYDEWLDRLGVAVQADTDEISNCTLASWYTTGLPVEQAVPLALEYLRDKK